MATQRLDFAEFYRTAEVLGIAPSTVKAHLARALASLRNDLVPERRQETPS